MAEGLRSRSAITKDNVDKNDDLFLRIKELQEQVHELVLDSRFTRQDREERAEMAARLAVVESKIHNKLVSNISKPLFTQSYQDQHHNTHKTPFKMKIPRFDGLDPLGWFSKINHFFTFTIHLKNNKFL